MPVGFGGVRAGGSSARKKRVQGEKPKESRFKGPTGIPEPTPEPKPVEVKASYVGKEKNQEVPIPARQDVVFETRPAEEEPNKPAYLEEEKQAGKKIGATEKTIFVSHAKAKEYQNYKDYQEFKEERERIESRLKGEQGIGGKVIEGTRFVSSVFIKPNVLPAIASEAWFGEKENKRDTVLNIYTQHMYGLNKVVKRPGWEGGVTGAFAESYKPGGYGFIATSAALTGTGVSAIGAASPTAASAAQAGLVGYGGYQVAKPLSSGNVRQFQTNILGAAIFAPTMAVSYGAGLSTFPRTAPTLTSRISGKIKTGAGKAYVSMWKRTPPKIRVTGYKIKQGIKTTKFKTAKFTRTGLYKQSSVTDIYSPGRWKSLSFKSEMFSVKKYILSGKGAEPRYSNLPKTTGWDKPQSGYLKQQAYDVPRYSNLPKTTILFRPGYKTPLKFKPVQTTSTITTSSSTPTKTVTVLKSPSTTYSQPSYYSDISYGPTSYPKWSPSFYHSGKSGWAGLSLAQLEKLEEGITQTSSRWNKVKPIRKTDTFMGMGINTKTSTGMKYATEIKPDISQGLTQNQINKMNQNVSNAINQSTRVTPTQDDKTKDKQLFYPIQTQSYKYDYAQKYKTKLRETVPPIPDLPKPYNPSKNPNLIWFKDKTPVSKKYKKALKFESLGKGYRYRKWKTPTLFKMIGGK